MTLPSKRRSREERFRVSPSGELLECQCARCLAFYPPSEFNRESGRQPYGLGMYCKQCRSAYRKERSPYDAAAYQEMRRLHNKNMYGLQDGEYERMEAEQGGVCAICKGKNRAPCFRRGQFGSMALHVDHCHKTGRVRGLICAYCNVALGRFDHDKESVEGAIAYLRDRVLPTA